MTQFPAYAVNGGKVPAEMLRTMAYAATSGANGVIKANALMVIAMPVPTGSVRIGAGAALLRSRYGGSTQYESYVISQDSYVNMSIPAGGSSGRTDYIIAKINDWHYTADPAPADPQNALYWSFSRVSTLSGLAYPYVPLAKITVPAGASNITKSMITDLRDVAIPRTEYHTFVPELAWGDNKTINSNTYQTVMRQTFEIPEWATVAVVNADIGGILASRNGGLFIGQFIASFADNADTEMMTRLESDSKQRMALLAGGEVPIPIAFRGQESEIRWRLRRTSGTDDLFIDANTSFRCSIQFKEAARLKNWIGDLH